MAVELSQLERALETIIATYHKHSGQHEDADTLNQKEFKQLVKKELPNFLKKQKKDDKAINHIMEDLDTNSDKNISFEEYAILIARLTHASHEEMHKNDHGPGHSHGPGLGEGGHGHSH